MLIKARSSALAALLLLGVPTSALAAGSQTFSSERVELRADIVARGLEHPWGMAFLPGGDVLVTERPGRMRLIGADGAVSAPLAGLPDIAVGGQGGLLDVAIAADFARSGTIFFTFSEPGRGGAGTAIARATLVRDGAAARLDGVNVLFSMPRKTRRGQHFGSRIVVHPDGTILFSTGDRGDGNRAQDMADAAGAVLRINADGSIPADNPYASGRGGALPQIWSKGHRNPQGMTIDSAGTLWTVEHGAKGGDEVNNPRPGRNYGWPVVSYGVHYSGAKIGTGTRAPGYEPPVHYWDPSIAPSGVVVYEGEMFPEWHGDLLVGALKLQLLSRLDRDETGRIVGEERMLNGAFGRIRDVTVAPDGAVWLLTDKADGEVIRLSRAR